MSSPWFSLRIVPEVGVITQMCRFWAQSIVRRDTPSFHMNGAFSFHCLLWCSNYELKLAIPISIFLIHSARLTLTSAYCFETDDVHTIHNAAVIAIRFKWGNVFAYSKLSGCVFYWPCVVKEGLDRIFTVSITGWAVIKAVSIIINVNWHICRGGLAVQALQLAWFINYLAACGSVETGIWEEEMEKMTQISVSTVSPFNKSQSIKWSKVVFFLITYIRFIGIGI